MAVNLSAYLSLKAKGFNQGIEKADAKVGKFKKGYGKLKNVMGAGLALGGVIAAAKAFASAADEIDNLSKRLGISAEKTQRLMFAAEDAGQNVELVSDAFKTLIKQTQLATAGNTKLAAQFESLGISMEMMKRGNIEEMFDQLNRALTTAPNKVEAVATAMIVLGEQQERLVQVLDAYNVNIDKVFSDKTVQVLDKLEGRWSKFFRFIKGAAGNTFAYIYDNLLAPLDPAMWQNELQKSAAKNRNDKGEWTGNPFLNPDIWDLEPPGALKRDPKAKPRERSKFVKSILGEQQAVIDFREKTGRFNPKIKTAASQAKIKEAEDAKIEAERLAKEQAKTQKEIAAEQTKYSGQLRSNLLNRLTDEEKLNYILKEQKELIKDANRLQASGAMAGMFGRLTEVATLQALIERLQKGLAGGTGGTALGGFGVTQSGMQQAGAKMGGVDHRLNLLNQKQVDVQEKMYAFMQRAVDNFQGRPKEPSAFGD